MPPSPPRPSTTAAALLLALIALLLHTSPSPAQQTSRPAVLPAPELTAQPADRAVSLTWTPVTGAARYELWSWTSDDGWQQIGGDNLTATSYSHAGIAPGVTCYYQIRAVNPDGEAGEWSQRVYATLPGNLPAPALTARASTGAIDLSWDPVPGAARYELWTWWHEDPGWQQLGGDNLTGTSYSHAGIRPRPHLLLPDARPRRRRCPRPLVPTGLRHLRATAAGQRSLDPHLRAAPGTVGYAHPDNRAPPGSDANRNAHRDSNRNPNACRPGDRNPYAYCNARGARISRPRPDSRRL